MHFNRSTGRDTRKNQPSLWVRCAPLPYHHHLTSITMCRPWRICHHGARASESSRFVYISKVAVFSTLLVALVGGFDFMSFTWWRAWWKILSNWPRSAIIFSFESLGRGFRIVRICVSNSNYFLSPEAAVLVYLYYPYNACKLPINKCDCRPTCRLLVQWPFCSRKIRRKWSLMGGISGVGGLY